MEAKAKAIQRAEIIQLYLSGMKPFEVSKKLEDSGAKRSTVYGTIKRYIETGSSSDRKRSGRPKRGTQKPVKVVTEKIPQQIEFKQKDLQQISNEDLELKAVRRGTTQSNAGANPGGSDDEFDSPPKTPDDPGLDDRSECDSSTNSIRRNIIPRSTRKMRKCLICRQDGEPLLKSTADSEMNKIHRSWAKTCIRSLCTLIQIPDSRDLFLSANYCEACLQLIRDIDFSLQQIKNFQKQILGFRNCLLDKLGENYDETVGDDFKLLYKKINEGSKGWTGTDFMDTEAPKSHQRIRDILEEITIKMEANDYNEPMDFDYEEEDNKEEFISSRRPHDVIKVKPEEDLDLNQDDDSDWNCSDAESAVEDVPKRVVRPEKKSRRKKIKKPLKLKVRQKAFRCKVANCDYVSDLDYALHAHQRKVHEGDPRPYHCVICNKTYTSSSSLSLHKKTHLRTGVISCSECNKEFKWEESLNRHMARDHSSTKCSFCGMDCETKEQLDEHENIHKNKDKPFTCIICDEVSTNSSRLRQHMLTHDEGRPICDVCGKSFQALRNLEKHRQMHEDLYVCTVCNKKCGSSYILKQHMASHSDERKYMCDVCGEAFKLKATLSTHKNKHDGELKFVCQVCGKGFTSSALLNGHEEIHSGTLSYECKICGKKFTAKNNLRQHEKGHGHKDPNKNKIFRPNSTKLSSQARKIKAKGKRISYKYRDSSPSECEYEEDDTKKSNQSHVQEQQAQTSQYPSTSTQQFQPEFYNMPYLPLSTFQYL